MKPPRPLLLIALLATAAAASAGGDAPAEEQPRNAALADSQGEPASLSPFRGKPLILFYDDRHSVAVNRPFKKELWEKAESLGLRKAAHVVAVANLQGYNFFPVRPIALSYVREEEQRVGVPVLVDLDGTLTRAPWSLPRRASSVMVLDSEGRVRFSHSGKLPPEKVVRFYETLGELLGVKLAAPPGGAGGAR